MKLAHGTAFILPAAAPRAQLSDERCVDRRPGDATASTMPAREFPRQSIKIKFISMLQAGNSSFFSGLFRENFPKNCIKKLWDGLTAPSPNRKRRN